uniref:Regulatory protein, LacI n=1 Tax=Nitratidesulfovibrio vulgaris (strain DSM 19637 / Miyazaki F) TaxID=883 RepID=B8DK77_NITV9
MTHDWLELLRHAAADRTKAAVARELGVSRPSVSLLLAGRYPGRTDRMAQRILETYGRVACPFLGRELTALECARHNGPMPTSSPAALRHWRACQACPHRPQPDQQNGGN